MSIALSAFSFRSTIDPSELPESFSSTAFHKYCRTKADFILIFQRVKLDPPSNLGTSYFADIPGTTFGTMMSPDLAQLFRSKLHKKNHTGPPLAPRPKFPLDGFPWACKLFCHRMLESTKQKLHGSLQTDWPQITTEKKRPAQLPKAAQYPHQLDALILCLKICLRR